MKRNLMRISAVLFLVVATALHGTAHASSAAGSLKPALDNFEKTYRRAKTVGGLMQAAGSYMNYDDYEFMVEQIEKDRSAQSPLPQLQRKNASTLIFEIQSVMIQVEWQSPSHVTINNRKLEFSSEESAEDRLQKIRKALPKSNATHIFQPLFLPRAEAFIDIASTVISLATTINEMWQKNAACPDLNDKTRECLKVLRAFSPRTVLPAQGRRRPSPGDDYEFRQNGKLRCPKDNNDTIDAIIASRQQHQGLERNLMAQVQCQEGLRLLNSCVAMSKCALIECGWTRADIESHALVGEVPTAPACRQLADQIQGRQNRNPSAAPQPPARNWPNHRPGQPLQLDPFGIR